MNSHIPREVCLISQCHWPATAWLVEVLVLLLGFQTLPLLTTKAQDVELAAATKQINALQQVNKALEMEAAEARRAELGTRPLMVRLMSTARKSQGTLKKLVAAIADYHLTMDEKNYLHSLAKDNDEMTEQLQKELPHFFSRIFVDSDQEFNTWAKAVADSVAKDPASTQTKPRARHKSSERDRAIALFNDPESAFQVLVTNVKVSSTALNLQGDCSLPYLSDMPWSSYI